jgi:hypothetical protein
MAVASIAITPVRDLGAWGYQARSYRPHRNLAVPPAPAQHRRKACPTFSTAAVQAYAALLQDHESARILGKPLLTREGLVYLRHRLLPAALNGAERNGDRASATATGALLPYWDVENRRLWLGTHLVKEFRQPAPNQITLLNVFQEQGWAGRIDDPLGLADGEFEKDAKRRLHETIKNLNRKLTVGTLRFRGDGTGEGVIWEYQRPGNDVGRGRRSRRRSVLSENAEARNGHAQGSGAYPRANP